MTRGRMDVTPEEQVGGALDVWARWTLERRDAEGLSDEERDLLEAWQTQQAEMGRFDSIDGVAPPGVAPVAYVSKDGVQVPVYRVDPDTDRCPRCGGVPVFDEAWYVQHLACEACGVFLTESSGMPRDTTEGGE